MIFECDDDEEYVEIILSEAEIDDLKRHSGVAMDFPYGFRNLNVFIRCEQKEEENATSERKGS